MIEKQRLYENKIIWIVFPLILGAVSITLFTDPDILKNSFTSVIVNLSVPLVIILLIAFIPFLETEYDSTGITYRFYPFHLKKRTILWSDVSAAYVRQYKPIAEYGGWGLRGLLGRNGRAYNVSGNIGLELELKNGEKILFGTRKKEALEKVIMQFFKK